MLTARLVTNIALVYCLIALGSACAATASSESAPPNFVIVIADDMGFSDLGCYGGEINTPHLDQLASGGLRFSQFYNTGRCWPTRACILTGYYAQQVRMDPPRGRLPKWAGVVPHHLSPLGYRSYHSGKWHLRAAPRAVADGGFHRSYLVADQDRFFSPKRTFLDDKPLPPVEPDSGYYATTAIADHGIEFLREHNEKFSDEPFFLYLAFTAPHFPLQALQAEIDRYRDVYSVGWDAVRQGRYQRLRDAGIVSCELSPREPDTVPHWNFPPAKLLADIGPGEVPRAVPWNTLTAEQRAFQATKMAIHAAMIDCIDQQVGRLVEQLKTMNALDNTVIFFLSDNGASAEQIIRGDMHDPSAAPGSAASYLCLGPGWSTAANTPFRRHKSWVHEGGIATPLIVHWPRGITTGGEIRHAPGHCVDFLPTLLELAGGKRPKQWNGLRPPFLPGVSLVPTFEEERKLEREYLYFSHGGNHAIRKWNHKLVKSRQDDEWRLYDMGADRSELRDIAAEQPSHAEVLKFEWTMANEKFPRLAEGEFVLPKDPSGTP